MLISGFTNFLGLDTIFKMLYIYIGHGHDLVAINVQRGRDHGLPGYNAYRKLFGLTSIASMDGKPDEMEDDAWETFKMVFREPQDIDLYPGGLSEKPLEGDVVK